MKAALTLVHGNAIPEGGFSVNNAMLGKERLLLHEKTIVAELMVKDATKVFGGVTNIPITKELLTAARKARSEYQLYLEQQRQSQALEQKQRIDQEQEIAKRTEAEKLKGDTMKKLVAEEKLQDELIKEQDIAHQLISEASMKLSAAMKKNDVSGAKVAEVMLTAGNTKLQDTAKQMDAVRLKIADIRKMLAASQTMVRKVSDEPVAKKKK